jgi:FAD/FMN-containing dehydrogenase
MHPDPSTDAIRPDRLAELARALGDRLVRPGDADYETGRQVLNAAIDRHPAAIVRATGVDDVVRAVTLAHASGVPLAVRGGSHSEAGFGTVDGGVVLDMAGLDELAIDPARRVARVGGGVRAGAYVEAAAAHGLVTPFGDTATVGIAGLTLGGGVGWLSRRHGLTIDSLRAVELVTADGGRITASATEHPDLFWALRGGGGNFGVVTALELDLHPLGPVYGGALFLPLTAAVVRGVVDLAAVAPDELTIIAAAMRMPSAPFVPAEVVGTPAFAILPAFAGDLEEGARVLAPFRALATPLVDGLAPLPFPAMYAMTAEGSKRQAGVIRSHFLAALDAAGIEAIVETLPTAPTPTAMVQVRVLGGAIARVPADATAYAHRDAGLLVAVIAAGYDPARTPEVAAWAERLAAAIAPDPVGAYVNFLGDEGEARVRAAYGEATWTRLLEVKRRWDPTNLFRSNQNLRA